MIITISREFGSGGREIAKRLADLLEIAYYDSEIITELAIKMNMDQEYVAHVLDTGVQFSVPLHFGRSFSRNSLASASTTAQMMGMQSVIMKELAAKGDCVIVGRAGDVILGECHPFRIFIYSNMSDKIARCQKRALPNEDMSEKIMEKKIRQIDKARAASYNLVSASRWGEKSNYDLCVNTSGIGAQTIVPLLAAYAKQWFERRENT